MVVWISLKAKYGLILWIVVPLIVYLVLATIWVWPILVRDAEKREQTVSPITLLPSAWAQAWIFIFMIPAYAFMNARGFMVTAFLVILAVAWLRGFSRCFGRYLEEILEEKADSSQKT